MFTEESNPSTAQKIVVYSLKIRKKNKAKPTKKAKAEARKTKTIQRLETQSH